MTMPLPLKKAKVARISQLVADLQSPKRGSLVVETGFPNSLIDLFVKNRDRFKTKPSSKNKKKNNHPVQISDPAILPPAPPSLSCLNSVEVSRIERHGCRQYCDDFHDFDYGLSVNVDEVVFIKSNHMSGIFAEILKIMIVVVLAMATKKLAVGITLSAFVLLFIEYVGKRLVCYEPFSKTLARKLKLLIRRDEITDSKSCTTDEIEENKTDLVVQDEEFRAQKPDVVEEKNTDLVVQDEEIRATEPDLDMHNCDKRWVYEEETGIRKRIMEEEDDDDVGEMKERNNSRRSRRAKFKAKVMNKLAPNKFGGSKKEKKYKERDPESSTDVSNHTSEDKLSICGLEKEIENDQRESSHSLSEQKQCEKEEDENIDDDGARCSGEISMATSTSIDREEEMGIEKKMNLRSLILILLILAGLVGGPSVALVLTLAWWLCLKSAGTLNRQSDLPMIRCPPVQFF